MPPSTRKHSRRGNSERHLPAAKKANTRAALKAVAGNELDDEPDGAVINDGHASTTQPAEKSGAEGGPTAGRRGTIVRRQWNINDFVPSTSRCIGRGSVGSVFLMTEAATGRRLAVKVMNLCKLATKADLHKLNFARAVRSEIVNHSRLRHPNIVSFYGDFVTTPVNADGQPVFASSKPGAPADGDLHLVTEYCSGGDLMRERMPLAEGVAACYIKQVAEALKYCHDKKVVHCDVKLENVMRASDVSAQHSFALFPPLPPSRHPPFFTRSPPAAVPVQHSPRHLTHTEND